MSDKGLSEAVDDFFDVRSLAAVLIGFVFSAWLEVIVLLSFGDNLKVLAIVWPIIFMILAVILANAGQRTNGDLKIEHFNEKIEKLRDEINDE